MAALDTSVWHGMARLLGLFCLLFMQSSLQDLCRPLYALAGEDDSIIKVANVIFYINGTIKKHALISNVQSHLVTLNICVVLSQSWQGFTETFQNIAIRLRWRRWHSMTSRVFIVNVCVEIVPLYFVPDVKFNGLPPLKMPVATFLVFTTYCYLCEINWINDEINSSINRFFKQKKNKYFRFND